MCLGQLSLLPINICISVVSKQVPIIISCYFSGGTLISEENKNVTLADIKSFILRRINSGLINQSINQSVQTTYMKMTSG